MFFLYQLTRVVLRAVKSQHTDKHTHTGLIALPGPLYLTLKM